MRIPPNVLEGLDGARMYQRAAFVLAWHRLPEKPSPEEETAALRQALTELRDAPGGSTDEGRTLAGVVLWLRGRGLLPEVKRRADGWWE